MPRSSLVRSSRWTAPRRVVRSAIGAVFLWASTVASPADAQSPAVPGAVPPGTPRDVVPATYVTSGVPGAEKTSPSQAPSVALSPPDTRTPPKLPLPGNAKQNPSAARGGGLVTMFGSLALVLGLFLLTVRLLRRGMPQPARPLPNEAVESLGRIAFPGRQQGHLLRVGNKVILVSFSNGGADVLAEVTDPAEVDRLAGLCAQADPHGAVQTFRGVVEQFFREKPSRPTKRSSASAAGREEDDVV